MQLLGKPSRVLLVLALSALRSAAAHEQEFFTPWRVAELRQVTSGAIDPHGRRAAYALAVPRTAGKDEDGAAWSELWVVDLEQGRGRPFVTGEVNVSALAWTRDGSEIAYLAKRGDDESSRRPG